MYAVQQPLAMSAFGDVMGVPSSHLAMVSHPGDVAQLIETAAEAVLATS